MTLDIKETNVDLTDTDYLAHRFSQLSKKRREIVTYLDHALLMDVSTSVDQFSKEIEGVEEEMEKLSTLLKSLRYAYVCTLNSGKYLVAKLPDFVMMTDILHGTILYSKEHPMLIGTSERFEVYSDNKFENMIGYRIMTHPALCRLKLK